MLQIQPFDQEIAKNIILLLPVLGIGISFIITRPKYFEVVGMMLGVLLNIPYLFILNIVATNMGWWEYAPSHNNFYSIPVELVLGWALFWGALLPYVLKKLPLLLIFGIGLMIDLWVMPELSMLFSLGSNWLVGELVLLLSCFLPALIIFRLTEKREMIFIRAVIQSIIWGGWIVFLIPAILLQYENKDIFQLLTLGKSTLVLFVAGMGVSFAIGYYGLWEFAKKGKGTPIPFDPPQILVTTGIYAYVANPLQISTLLIFICIAIVFQSYMMIFAMTAHIIYCEGFVRWHHSVDIEKRFGEDWFEYKRQVRNWIPKLK